MKFVKNHAGRVGKLRVRLQQAGKHPLGEHLQLGGVADAGFVPHAQAHGAAHVFVQGAGQVAGQGTGGHTAGLQQQDAALLVVLPQPRGGQQPEGQASAFARTGLGLQDQAAAQGQGAVHL